MEPSRSSPSTGSKAAKAQSSWPRPLSIPAAQKNNFKFLYDYEMPLRKRIELIAKEVYGANGVSYSEIALEKLKSLEANPATQKFGMCMAKTHLEFVL